ncbi:MAG: four helix bundle protein [Bacteroidota bacterium]
MSPYNFEKLTAWQLAFELSIKIYNTTSIYPKEERYGLVSQMRRAAVSIQSNLAEGSARISHKEKAHFYSMAYSSLMELINQLMLSNHLGYMESEIYHEIKEESDSIARLISGLRKSQINK